MLRLLCCLLLAAACLRAQVVEESFARDPGPLDFICGEGHEQFILQSLTGDALVGLDGAGRVVPRLAERWEAKGGILRFHLRAGARFSDGSPVGAADVVWTFQEIQRRPEASPTKRGILAGVTVRAEGAAVRLESPKPPARLLMELARIPVARRDRPDTGSGPFSLALVRGEWHLAARPHALAPRIAGLHFRRIADEQGILQALQKGWLTLGVPPARRGLRPPPSHVELQQALHAQLVVWSRLGPGPLRCLARWRSEAFPQGFFGTKARPARGLWPETLGFPPLAVAAPEPGQLRGQRWEILYSAGDDLVQKALLALRERARADGVDLVPTPLEAALVYERLQKGDFQLACASVIFDPHPWAVLEYLEPRGPMNFTGWTHPRLPALLRALRDPEGPAWLELQRAWAEAPAALPLLDLVSVLWVDRRLAVQTGPWGLYLTTPGAAGWRWTP